MYPALEIRNTSKVERAVVEAMLIRDCPVSQAELTGLMRDPPSQSTISRAMSALIDKGLVVKQGQTRGSRFALTPDARRVATDPRLRAPIPYDADRIAGYEANTSRWLSEKAATRMRRAVDDAGGQRLDASTYSRSIAERFLIDLAWASSALEGNTYDQLSTEVLIKYGQSASGRDRQETAMILNHENAIAAMLDDLDEPFPTIERVQRRHALMMRDLMDPFDIGTIRRNAVQVGATSYRPSADPAELGLGLATLLEKAARVEDPLEASFFLLAGLSYLQSFADGNKRMGRLLSNEPLLRAGLPPLSFVGIDKGPYMLGLIEFYETGETDLLGEAVAQSYTLTAPEYLRAVTVSRVPHALELRERDRISDAMGRLFREDIPTWKLPALVEEMFQDLPPEDRETMVGILTEIADRASPASAVLYGVTEKDILRRRGES